MNLTISMRWDITRSVVIPLIQPPTLIYEITDWQGGANNADEISDLVIVTDVKKVRWRRSQASLMDIHSSALTSSPPVLDTESSSPA